jgi:hypothetical protein
MTVQSIRRKIKKAHLSILSIYLYGCGLVILFSLFVFAWISNAISGGAMDVQIIISFFNSYTSATVVGAIAFVSIFSVNKNNDGDSDIAEKKAIEGNASIGKSVVSTISNIGKVN